MMMMIAATLLKSSVYNGFLNWLQGNNQDKDFDGLEENTIRTDSDVSDLEDGLDSNRKNVNHDEELDEEKSPEDQAITTPRSSFKPPSGKRRNRNKSLGNATKAAELACSLNVISKAVQKISNEPESKPIVQDIHDSFGSYIAHEMRQCKNPRALSTFKSKVLGALSEMNQDQIPDFQMQSTLSHTSQAYGFSQKPVGYNQFQGNNNQSWESHQYSQQASSGVYGEHDVQSTILHELENSNEILYRY